MVGVVFLLVWTRLTIMYACFFARFCGRRFNAICVARSMNEAVLREDEVL